MNTMQRYHLSDIWACCNYFSGLVRAVESCALIRSRQWFLRVHMCDSLHLVQEIVSLIHIPATGFGNAVKAHTEVQYTFHMTLDKNDVLARTVLHWSVMQTGSFLQHFLAFSVCSYDRCRGIFGPFHSATMIWNIQVLSVLRMV